MIMIMMMIVVLQIVVMARLTGQNASKLLLMTNKPKSIHPVSCVGGGGG